MAAVRGKNTTPEMVVRRALHASGFRFRLHNTKLPGKPDIVLHRFRTVIFVHGCFWHGHACPRGARKPASRAAYWETKISGNRRRDRQHFVDLRKLGWNVVVIWECELNARRHDFENFVRTKIATKILEFRQGEALAPQKRDSKGQIK